jgi:phosphonate transport system substrate-binding protein
MPILNCKKVCRTLLPLFILSHIFCITFAGKAMGREEGLVIGLLPEINVFKQKKRFEPLAAYLSKHLGIPVNLTMLSRYGNVISRMKKEEVDGAFLGSFTGALAITQLNAEPLARPINTDGTSTYFGRIFVKKSSSINSVSDMKGKTLALVERATTGGYVFPLAWLKHQGVDDIKTKNTIYELMRRSDPRIDTELVVLAESPRVPSNGLFVRENLGEEYKVQLKELLLNLHQDAEGFEVLRQLGAKRFVETDREDYKPVFDMAVKAGIDLKTYDYYNP